MSCRKRVLMRSEYADYQNAPWYIFVLGSFCRGERKKSVALRAEFVQKDLLEMRSKLPYSIESRDSPTARESPPLSMFDIAEAAEDSGT